MDTLLFVLCVSVSWMCCTCGVCMRLNDVDDGTDLQGVSITNPTMHFEMQYLYENRHKVPLRLRLFLICYIQSADNHWNSINYLHNYSRNANRIHE